MAGRDGSKTTLSYRHKFLVTALLSSRPVTVQYVQCVDGSVLAVCSYWWSRERIGDYLPVLSLDEPSFISYVQTADLHVDVSLKGHTH